MQINFRLGIIPGTNDADCRARPACIGLVKLYPPDRFAFGRFDFNTVRPGTEQVRTGLIAIGIGQQAQWIAVDNELVRFPLADGGGNPAGNHAAFGLGAAVN